MKRVVVKYQALFLLPNICNGKGGGHIQTEQNRMNRRKE